MVFVRLVSFRITLSRFIHFDENSNISPFYENSFVHIYITLLLHPFIHRWTFRSFSYLSYCK